MRATSAPACWPPKRSAAGSRKVARAMSADVADFDDLELACPAGRLDRHLVALVLADQRTRDRRRNRDLAVLDVGFQVTHDLVALLLAAVGVGQQHGRAEHDPGAGIERGDVDDLRMRQLSLELLDPALDEALLLARGVVHGVLLQVAVRTRLRSEEHTSELQSLMRISYAVFRLTNKKTQ